MSKQAKTAISPTREENYPEWYQQVVRAAELAENSDVRGCMVIKPWGYALWENIRTGLDGFFKATGHSNAYFPLFIPVSYLEKEAERFHRNRWNDFPRKLHHRDAGHGIIYFEKEILRGGSRHAG